MWDYCRALYFCLIASGEKKKGKIQIINLKNSAVFQETIRAVEEKQKQKEEKKAKYEEGELSSESSDSSGGEKGKVCCAILKMWKKKFSRKNPAHQ